jgi:transposase InsO family protein
MPQHFSMSANNECKEFFPFYITHVLTDNGLEFTDKFARGRTEPSNNHVFDKACNDDDIEHRLTAPYTPKTNGMVERINGIIKDATIKAHTYSQTVELRKDLFGFLKFYIFNRNHGSLRKELKVKKPFEAMQKWYSINPELFWIPPDVFHANALKILEQRCET